tara:strand:+ start:27920 stop:28882 length:963 start_codon:yes stop_codon:yes gene_type:complete
MKKILANDGISKSAKLILEKNGFNVSTDRVEQDNLASVINKEKYQVLLVRSATKVKKELIEKCPNLKIIGRAGVGMDNIDISFAQKKGIKVFNTPSSSTESVAELVFAHLFGMVRYLFDSNRQMPLIGESKFKELKKSYSNGKELSKKTLGIIGFGRIGQAVAKKAIALGMNIAAYDKNIKEADISLSFFNGAKTSFTIKCLPMKEVLNKSDFLSLHIPKTTKKAFIGSKEIGMMKDGAGIINTSRGGLIDEDALMFALEKGKLNYAGLDVYSNEPTPKIHLMMHPKISLSPHIGAATIEAQERIGIEISQEIISYFERH